MGVAGYILKRSASEELTRGIHAAATGGIYLDPAIAGQAVGRLAQAASNNVEGVGFSHLSAREQEVMQLAALCRTPNYAASSRFPQISR
jgi:DNA-binding NarL/FixJ family response regulator